MPPLFLVLAQDCVLHEIGRVLTVCTAAARLGSRSLWMDRRQEKQLSSVPSKRPLPSPACGQHGTLHAPNRQ